MERVATHHSRLLLRQSHERGIAGMGANCATSSVDGEKHMQTSHISSSGALVFKSSLLAAIFSVKRSQFVFQSLHQGRMSLTLGGCQKSPRANHITLRGVAHTLQWIIQ